MVKKHKEKLRKKARERYQNISEEEKLKGKKSSEIDIKKKPKSTSVYEKVLFSNEK